MDSKVLFGIPVTARGASIADNQRQKIAQPVSGRARDCVLASAYQAAAAVPTILERLTGLCRRRPQREILQIPCHGGSVEAVACRADERDFMHSLPGQGRSCMFEAAFR